MAKAIYPCPFSSFSVKRLHRNLLLLLTFVAAGAGVRQLWREKQRNIRQQSQADFKETVSPLLRMSCVRCHGAESQKGRLRLDTLAGALKGGASGPALVPYEPDKSLMLIRALHNDSMREIPPKDPPSEEDLAVMRRWIATGAQWPEKREKSAPTLAKKDRVGDAWSDPRNPVTKAFDGKRLDLWSLQPIKRQPIPPVRDKSWPRTELDHFTLAAMEKAGVKPAAEAPWRTLIRRLYLDMTGLPPTPEQMEEHAADSSGRAYERLVDRLLESPAYGEHWARFWLDVVRYSDSNGFDYDEFRPTAWTFRDYVVRSLNADKAYDRFAREQIAGDEMVENEPRDEEERDCLIGTGYLRIGPYDNSAARFGERDRCRAQVLSDLVETTGAVFLGINFVCSKCHDHKTDPITQADYYRFRAFFEPSRPADEITLDLGEEAKQLEDETLAVERAAQAVRDIENPVFRRLRAQNRVKLSKEKQQLITTSADQLSEFLREKARLAKAEAEPTLDQVLAALTPDEKAAHQKATAHLADLEKKRTEPQKGFMVTDSVSGPFETFLLHQGDFLQPRDRVEPGVPAVLDPNPLPPAKVKRENSTGRRTALVEWLFSEQNPLTARVIVNRIWQGHFGTGLVATPNDFGHGGARPSHPELLDWLALRFRADGWSFKKLHRLILNSATYRQGMTTPELAGAGSFFHHRAPRRMTAESIRDSLLQVSGLLSPKKGGPPVWPEIPQEVLLTSPSALFDDESKTRGWYPSPHDQTLVRSLYLVQKRSLQVPLLAAFDLPDNNLSCACRPVSTVAPQALTLMNNEFMQEVVHALADRVHRETGEGEEEQVRRVYALALQRTPDADELEVCTDFLHRHGLRELCRSLLNLNEFAYVD